MSVVGSRARSCPEREALGTGELGKEYPFLRKHKGWEDFLRLPMNLGQLCGHPGSQGGRCAFLVLCLQRQKGWLLWISYPALGERPHPRWAFGCLFQLLVTTSKGHLNCESSLLLWETQKCLLLDSVIFLCAQVFLLLFLLILFFLKLLLLLFLKIDGCGWRQ